jgi:hypothetical protein
LDRIYVYFVQQGALELELWQSAQARKELIATLGDLKRRPCPDGVYIVKLHDPGDKETYRRGFSLKTVELSEANAGRKI